MQVLSTPVDWPAGVPPPCLMEGGGVRKQTLSQLPHLPISTRTVAKSVGRPVFPAGGSNRNLEQFLTPWASEEAELWRSAFPQGWR